MERSHVVQRFEALVLPELVLHSTFHPYGHLKLQLPPDTPLLAA